MSPEVRPQTRSEIAALLGAADVRLSRRRGQSFLVDGNLMRLVVEAAGIEPSDLVFEVGTGTGSLTRLIAEAAHEVLTVEVDARLVAVARDVLDAFDNVTLIRADVLAGKHRLNPEVLDALRAAAAGHPRTRLVANLPYSIATPLVLNLVFGDVVFERMVFTVQREVAERLTASPGTRAYGWASVVIALSGDIEVLRDLPSTAFWPRPEVTSSLVRFRPRRDWTRGIDVDRFTAFGGYVFQQRRKTVLRIVRDYLKNCPGAPEAAAVLETCRIAPRTRGDQLSPAQIVELSRTIPPRRTP